MRMLANSLDHLDIFGMKSCCIRDTDRFGYCQHDNRFQNVVWMFVLVEQVRFFGAPGIIDGLAILQEDHESFTLRWNYPADDGGGEASQLTLRSSLGLTCHVLFWKTLIWMDPKISWCSNRTESKIWCGFSWCSDKMLRWHTTIFSSVYVQGETTPMVCPCCIKTLDFEDRWHVSKLRPRWKLSTSSQCYQVGRDMPHATTEKTDTAGENRWGRAFNATYHFREPIVAAIPQPIIPATRRRRTWVFLVDTRR